MIHAIIPEFQRLRQDSEFQGWPGLLASPGLQNTRRGRGSGGKFSQQASWKIRVLFAVEGLVGMVVWAYPSRTVEGRNNF